jgi:GNAT superfamily N-acetyltransferase
MPPSFTIRATQEADWPDVRRFRLEMLADTPIAFSETIETADTFDEAEWRMRARRGEGEHGTTVVAIDDASGRWIGTMGGFVPALAGPLLVGVFVSREFRGHESGVADALLDAIEHWARSEGDALNLNVHEQNSRAIAFYRRRGYELTGRAHPYGLDPGCLELEMKRQLASA